jgi:hypothetical protein
MKLEPVRPDTLLLRPLYVDQSAIRVTSNGVLGRTNLLLRSVRVTDPPILVAIPALLAALNARRLHECAAPQPAHTEIVALNVGALIA